MFTAIKVTTGILSSAMSKEANIAQKALYILISKCDEHEKSLKGTALEAYRKYMIYNAQKRILIDNPPGSTISTSNELEANLINALQNESSVPEELKNLAAFAAMTIAIWDAKINKKFSKIFGVDALIKTLEASKPALIASGASVEELNEVIADFKSLV